MKSKLSAWVIAGFGGLCVLGSAVLASAQTVPTQHAGSTQIHVSQSQAASEQSVPNVTSPTNPTFNPVAAGRHN